MLQRRLPAPCEAQALDQENVRSFVERPAPDGQLRMTHGPLVLSGRHCPQGEVAQSRIDEPRDALALDQQPRGELRAGARLDALQQIAG